MMRDVLNGVLKVEDDLYLRSFGGDLLSEVTELVGGVVDQNDDCAVVDVAVFRCVVFE